MRDLFTKDLGWKLFSLFLAAAIWLTVNRILHEASQPPAPTSGTPVTYGNLPVAVVSATADVRAFRVMPTTVKVTVTGPAAVMETLQANDLHITVNVPASSLLSGRLLPVEISTPPNVAVASIEPDKVLVIIPTLPEKKP
jgi:YbbR domain-containing protein